MVLLREEIGDVLRDFRQDSGRTLRRVAGDASVALGYLSEVERGQKEVSSEILAAIAEALDVPLSEVIIEVGQRMALRENLSKPISATIPDSVTSDLMRGFQREFAGAK